MRRIAALVLSAGLSLATGQALACPYPDHHHRHGEDAAYGERRESYEDRRESYRYEDEGYAEDGYAEDRYGPRRYDDAPPPPPPPRYGASAWYMDGRHPPCDCAPAGGPVELSNSFFDDAGGVGPIPGGDWYGAGGYYVAGDGYGYGHGYASARSYASASSSASASVNIRGGARYGGYVRGGKGGHKSGGCNSCGHKGGKS